MNVFRHTSRVLVAAVMVAAVWFYYWTVGSPRIFDGPQADYYNLQLDGFQAGQLAMKVTPDPWLGVDNTKVTHYLMDASFHDGKYYLYFGVTPLLVLHWPWALLTGHDLPEKLAVALLASLAFLLSVGWLAALRRHFFPGAGGIYWLAAVVVLAVASGYPVVLRRPMFYEIAILSGLAFSLGGLWCLTLALVRRDQAVWWLGVASLCAGLAAGSRPTLIPGAVLAVALAALLVAWCEWRERRPLTAGRVLRLSLAAVLPAGICGLGLAWYNWARFDSPFDFGLLHQLGINGNGFPFTLGFLWKNLLLYYFTPPDFSWFFPFFAPGPKPLGSYQEQVHGQFFVLPLFILAVGQGVARFRRVAAGARERRAVIAAAGVWSGVTCVVVAMAWVHANRYQLDFHPVFLVLALLGFFAALESGARWRRAAQLVLGWCVVLVVFNVCTSFHVHGFFRETWPAHFERIARVADRLVWPVHQWAAPRLGGQEVVVKFPAGAPGSLEPLLVAGGGADMDGLLIRYTTPGRGRIVFEHLHHGGVESEEFDLQPGRARWLRIHLGTLYPPPWHPWYDKLPPGMARARNRVSVRVDDVEVLNRDVVCYQASANQVSLGERAGFLIGAARFTGEIARVRGLKTDQAWWESLKLGGGVVRLRLLLPRDRFGAQEPLVMTGMRGKVDLVSIHYVSDGVVRFSVFHENGPTVNSADLAWDYEQPLDVVIGLDSLRSDLAATGPRTSGVQVEADGQIVLTHDFKPHPAEPSQVYVGCIPWPVGQNRLMFGGAILEQSRVPDDAAPLRRARRALVAGRKVALQFALSRPPDGLNQPLLTAGITGRGFGLYVEYLGQDKVRFGFDHWGSALLVSAPVTIVPGASHRLVVSLGAKLSATQTVPGRLRVWLDDQVLFDQPTDLFPAEPELVWFGENPIGLSTSRPKFDGEFGLVPVTASLPSR
jgi:hypothetical protein